MPRAKIPVSNRSDEETDVQRNQKALDARPTPADAPHVDSPALRAACQH
jgi:hypothetical protein